ncbi:putative GTP-binding protein 6 [Neocloeon triangulifer]|uniref:putative GTP-binding protein 6 n=1 Tax=Neocloeon triangulifer TaxID=2078957 RepID=UPI00286ED17F|nr:putative GTP-binding protein 6 [Neocloeon triangulifer]
MKFSTLADEDGAIFDDKSYDSLIESLLPGAPEGKQLLVLQPYVKWGPKKKTNTTPDLQLEEAAALVSTLHRWSVVDQKVVPLENIDKRKIFGKGKLEELKQLVRRNKEITGVFISHQFLKMHQKIELEKVFRVPVYDRYSIVIQIFKENAITKHAKLQVALAELPYIRNMLLSETPNVSLSFGMSPDAIRTTLHTRENKLKEEMRKCQTYHHTLEKNRLQRKIPLVAVVGYTNAGKTSIIKALTGEKKLEPKNSLFATLDVTMHEGFLPNRLKVLYIDTVGFMSDLPHSLLECFIATLDHVAYADAVLHICDGSHPDLVRQREHVFSTLQSLKNLPPNFLDRVITVSNKCDKTQSETKFKDDLPVSARNRTGLVFLERIIESVVLKTTGRKMMIIRVPSGGPESQWLYKETAVCEAEADPKDPQYLLLKVVISDVEMGKFKSYFLNK